jgi:pimeloyl-ACP methyl ester carboxylesterase
MAQRAHATTVEVNGASHAVLVSQPDKVADLIIKAAEARK